ncbi:vitamin K epoxide reductase family protein [Corynebacterium marinum]|uniref:Vitamin K epoxide reductase domain-containing protein n=1 Tax=Corynebacterium marinum DSM 44953 TaxID=1224162 RepID=A0A0B6TZK6_9CORY|nr:vitamin K epoxide reductase family protein [Corynebacterium marinum]AJK70141.1 hypothetical protein B840_12865 [Corynebacterium marinum DSM 44953]GGO22213.1 membrane protein [Corynebacterium marinum]
MTHSPTAEDETEVLVTETNTATSLPAVARDRPFALILLITGVIGWVASGILVLERLALYEDAEHVTTCDINALVSCGKVMGTWQSELLGFPNPLIGIVAFAVVITTAMAMLSGARFADWYWGALQAGVTVGLLFIVWLWYQALFVIHILCLYCLVVWAMMVPLFILLTVRNLAHGLFPASPAVVRFSSQWAGTLIAVVYVAVAASVFFSFYSDFITL